MSDADARIPVAAEALEAYKNHSPGCECPGIISGAVQAAVEDEEADHG